MKLQVKATFKFSNNIEEMFQQREMLEALWEEFTDKLSECGIDETDHDEISVD